MRGNHISNANCNFCLFISDLSCSLRLHFGFLSSCSCLPLAFKALPFAVMVLYYHGDAEVQLKRHIHHEAADADDVGVFGRVIFRNAYYPPHRHRGLTTHLILRGNLTIAYPEDGTADTSTSAPKETFGPGARIDVDAGRVHEVWMSDEGCTYVIGE
jgi:hypothetical protein